MKFSQHLDEGVSHSMLTKPGTTFWSSVSVQNCSVDCTGLCCNSTLTVTFSRSLAHHICHYRAGNKLQALPQPCMAAVLGQAALPLHSAILLFSAHIPQGSRCLLGRLPAGLGVVLHPGRPAECLWLGRAIWRMLHPRLVSLTHTWLGYL